MCLALPCPAERHRQSKDDASSGLGLLAQMSDPASVWLQALAGGEPSCMQHLHTAHTHSCLPSLIFHMTLSSSTSMVQMSVPPALFACGTDSTHVFLHATLR